MYSAAPRTGAGAATGCAPAGAEDEQAEESLDQREVEAGQCESIRGARRGFVEENWRRLRGQERRGRCLKDGGGKTGGELSTRLLGWKRLSPGSWGFKARMGGDMAERNQKQRSR